MSRKGEPNGKCAVCGHPQRYQVELALVSGVSCRAVADKYRIHRDAVWRHGHNHISPERRSELVGGPLKPAELAQRAADEGMSLLDYLAIVRNSLMARFLAASECDDRQGAALLAGRITELLRFQASLTGELSRAGATITNNIAVMSSPLMSDLQLMLIRKLQPFPEARTAVIGGLEELSRRALPEGTGAAISVARILPGATIDAAAL